MKTNFETRRSGFSLVALIVLILLAVAAVGMIFPYIAARREAARRMQCVNNLKQLALAVLNYHAVNCDLPPEGLSAPDQTPERQMGLFPRLLPFLEQSSLFDTLDWDDDCDSGANAAAGKRALNVLLCPGGAQCQSVDPNDSGAFTSHYYGNFGVVGENPSSHEAYPIFCSNRKNGDLADNGVFRIGKGYDLSAVVDGTSNTLMFFESSADNYDGYRAWQRGAFQLAPPDEENELNPWGDWIAHSSKTASLEFKVNAPLNAGGTFHAPINAAVVASGHSGGANWAFVDGAVGFFSNDISDDVFLAFFSRNGG